MRKLEMSIKIKVPPEKVWEMLAFDRFPEWIDGFIEVEYTSEVNTPEDKYRVGATAHGTPKIRGKTYKFNCLFEIKESLENEKITHRIWEKAFRRTMGFQTTYTLEPFDGGTKLTLVGDLEIPWRILGTIYKALTLRAFRKQLTKLMESLKTVLEK